MKASRSGLANQFSGSRKQLSKASGVLTQPEYLVSFQYLFSFILLQNRLPLCPLPLPPVLYLCKKVRSVIPCLTPSNVLPSYVTAETGSVECPGFAALSTLLVDLVAMQIDQDTHFRTGGTTKNLKGWDCLFLFLQFCSLFL